MCSIAPKEIFGSNSSGTIFASRKQNGNSSLDTNSISDPELISKKNDGQTKKKFVDIQNLVIFAARFKKQRLVLKKSTEKTD